MALFSIGHEVDVIMSATDRETQVGERDGIDVTFTQDWEHMPHDMITFYDWFVS